MDTKPNLFNGIETLFDHIPQCMFFVKDRDGRFLKVNEALARVFGASSCAAVVGKSDADYLPTYIAESYRRDDMVLFETGKAMRDRVELVTNPAGIVDWIITTKVPFRDESGAIVGVAGFARPYEGELTASTMPEELQAAISHIRKKFRTKLRVPDLAELAGRSVSAFERSFRKHLHMTPTDFVRRVRIHEACQRLLQSQATIAKIAIDCGFSDQAHLSRDFKRVMLTSPVNYRRNHC